LPVISKESHNQETLAIVLSSVETDPSETHVEKVVSTPTVSAEDHHPTSELNGHPEPSEVIKVVSSEPTVEKTPSESKVVVNDVNETSPEVQQPQSQEVTCNGE
jgi:hypothetical protein